MAQPKRPREDVRAIYFSPSDQQHGWLLQRNLQTKLCVSLEGLVRLVPAGRGHCS